MNDEEVFARLKKVLSRHGLSLDDPEVKHFFFRERKIKEYKEFDIDAQKVYLSSVGIKPVKVTLLPSDFENSGYGSKEQTRLIDWFLYRNSGHNSLVWENIGKDSLSIKQSFEQTREREGPIDISIDGKFYNGADGNHRLLTLIINHFLERSSAKTEEEKLAVDKMYEMELEVCIPCCEELYQLLDKEMQAYAYKYWQKDDERIFPNSVCKYREAMYDNDLKNTYFVTFNPEENSYEYNLNGVKFKGNEQELIKFLKTKEDTNLPIMMWECDGTYYISCYNKVWKSKDETKILQLKPKIIKSFTNRLMDYHQFLEIKDIDTNTYQLRLDDINVRGETEAKQFATVMMDFLEDEQTDVLFYEDEKWADREEFLKYCKQSFKVSFDCLIFNEKEYKNLTKEQYLKISQQLICLEECLKKINTTVGC